MAPGWSERIAAARVDLPSESQIVIPRSAAHYAAAVTEVRTVAASQDMVAFVRQRDISFAGVALLYGSDEPLVGRPNGERVVSVRGTRPFAFGFAFGERAPNSAITIYRFVVVEEEPGVFDTLAEVFRSPITFVGHDLRFLFFALWKVGFPEPKRVWDTVIAARAMCLGEHHARYQEQPGDSSGVFCFQQVNEARAAAVSLHELAGQYEIDPPPSGWSEDRNRLAQGSTVPPSLKRQQIDDLARTAVCVSRLYQPQVLEATGRGILDHLVRIEMPWVATTSRMTWNGARIDYSRSKNLTAICARHLHDLGLRLASQGVRDASNDEVLRQFFAPVGLLDRFQTGPGRFSFDKDRLEAAKELHPAIPQIWAYRRVRDFQNLNIFDPAFYGPDDRVHPEYVVLGAHTGRLTARHPNLPGIGRLFRPLVIPDEGYGIGEVDYCQFEPGIAGAVYRDAQLIEMFNSGDLYSAMAKEFYCEKLDATARSLPVAEFKIQHRDKRDAMKVCTLGLLYGLTEEGLAKRMNVNVSVAAEFRNRFLAMFPQLRRGLEEVREIGAIRGGAVTTSGLRRYRPGPGHPSTWERNWFANFPIQGTAANLFKLAGNRLDRLYPAYDARLILPMHDAFVFEAPLDALQDVAELTSRVMREVVMEEFPELLPRVEINISHPEFWNKDGHHDSIQRWLLDPSYSI